ncbi:MAG: SRPBCC family protein, partial [Vicinamibacterales bacterium]
GVLTDHAAEPSWLPAFGSVVRQPDIGRNEVWTHSSPDRSFNFTLMTISSVAPQRYERILVRDNQPRNQSWDGHWIFELEPVGPGTRMRITELGWTDGFPFFVSQRILANPDAFLQYYGMMIGRQLNDPAQLQVIRSH